MSADRPRKFTIADGMILIVAVAVGLVVARAVLALQPFPPSWWGVSALQASVWVMYFTSLILIPLGLRPPRADRDALWRRPGWVASVAVGLASGFWAVQLALRVGTTVFRAPTASLRRVVGADFLDLSYRLPYDAACAVSIVWLMAALSGRWSAERGWVDRLGRAIGCYWVAYPVLDVAVSLVR